MATKKQKSKLTSNARGDVNPFAPLKPRNVATSQQVKFKTNAPRHVLTPATGSRQVRIAQNGLLDKVGVPSAIAMRNKRKAFIPPSI